MADTFIKHQFINLFNMSPSSVWKNIGNNIFK